ncbi:hypothetical protein KFK09_024612 [Dendrobium nobile]|uniref:Uncharacterized protein n=1 Tax=Dendrobium nobile TaxID=94219 RepID=A0A8T3AEJ5_DENNO|nr:hypothetical protein KFK09_024612 [Dendrobium nobile]
MDGYIFLWCFKKVHHMSKENENKCYLVSLYLMLQTSGLLCMVNEGSVALSKFTGEMQSFFLLLLEVLELFFCSYIL